MKRNKFCKWCGKKLRGKEKEIGLCKICYEIQKNFEELKRGKKYG
jgi:NMD protein affecting ribosome stability and mRNA decay